MHCSPRSAPTLRTPESYLGARFIAARLDHMQACEQLQAELDQTRMLLNCFSGQVAALNTIADEARLWLIDAQRELRELNRDWPT